VTALGLSEMNDQIGQCKYHESHELFTESVIIYFFFDDEKEVKNHDNLVGEKIIFS
jgi:hypothetical protein